MTGVQTCALPIFYAPTSGSGTFAIASGGRLSLNGAGSSIDPAGKPALTVQGGGTLGVTGSLRVGANAEVTGTDTTLEITGTLQVDTSISPTSNGRIHLAGGSITGDGNVNVPSSGTLTVSGGTVDGTGTLAIASGGHATIALTSTFYVNKPVTNAGTWTQTSDPTNTPYCLT